MVIGCFNNANFTNPFSNTNTDIRSSRTQVFRFDRFKPNIL